MGARDVRPPVGPLEGLYDRMLRYEWFASRYGWTPTQVDAESRVRLDALMVIGGTKAELQQELEDRAAAEARIASRGTG